MIHPEWVTWGLGSQCAMGHLSGSLVGHLGDYYKWATSSPSFHFHDDDDVEWGPSQGAPSSRAVE